MKRTKVRLLFIIVLFVLQTVPLMSYGAEKVVNAKLPSFRVQINGTVVDSLYTEFPLIVYKDITYMPMTYDFCNLLGLESSWTEAGGLKVSLRSDGQIPTITETKSHKKNLSKVLAYVVDTPITINGKTIENSKETYPLLRYKDITYFPLTYKFTKEAFNIYNNFNDGIGLMIYSENKFFYKYDVGNSQKQYTDFRVSNIRFHMVAVNTSDGTQTYPSNNVAWYDAYDCGVPRPYKYEGTKYYGYLPDGNGGLKANTDSEASPFGFSTTIITDLKNPLAEKIDLF